jgi:phosphohistidine phosphatase SixA
MKKIATGLKTLGVKPDLIVSSPFVRSLQTAEIL